ncbi:MAG TPA: hypothetical protein VLW85_10685 [Myxococcales bacterium]|nr:hypothetical protein [Myxococcales bacterium]
MVEPTSPAGAADLAAAGAGFDGGAAAGRAGAWSGVISDGSAAGRMTLKVF